MRIHRWDYPENIVTVDFPIALVQTDSNQWVASTVNDEQWLGEGLSSFAQGDTKEEAVKNLFNIIRVSHEYTNECRLSDQRWVPFKKGPWGSIGGNWFAVFGIHFNFRYGKGKRGGWYVPMTKLNISVHSDWALYRSYKKKHAS